jgi:hypothetical protein
VKRRIARRKGKQQHEGVEHEERRTEHKEKRAERKEWRAKCGEKEKGESGAQA